MQGVSYVGLAAWREAVSGCVRSRAIVCVKTEAVRSCSEWPIVPVGAGRPADA